MPQKKNPAKAYSLGEEIFNSVSHGVGSLLSIAATVLLIVFSPKKAMVITSVSIYGASLILLYVMSCLYHAFTNMRVKKVFQIFDHVSIYLLIAGTYTPYCLVSLGGLRLDNVRNNLGACRFGHYHLLGIRQQNAQDKFHHLHSHGLACSGSLYSPKKCPSKIQFFPAYLGLSLIHI